LREVYVVTSAQYNARPHLPFLRNLEAYIARRDAELLVIPMAGKNIEERTLHEALQKHKIVDGRLRLNEKIQVERYHIRPQQIDPITGIGRFSANDISTIFESSKQRMKVVPNSVTNLPKVLMTTGAVTRPNYNIDNRIGRIADKDHIYGAIVVEITGAKEYHYRILRANSRGHFVDFGVKTYDGGIRTKVGLEAMIAGDWHTGDTDKKVRKATFDMIRTLKPQKLFLHDFFNGHSVNWFQERKKISQARHHRENRMSLEDELEICAKELRTINDVHSGREVFIVKSNHDERLDSYIQEARYLDHTENLYIGSKLTGEMVDGIDPLVAGISLFWEIPDNITFLDRDTEIKIRRWLLSAHGDKGANGARGNVRGLENAYGRSVSGHSHTPEIYRDTIKVGTSSELNLDYNSGYASSWMNTHALIYETGSFQLVNIINGKWRGQKS